MPLTMHCMSDLPASESQSHDGQSLADALSAAEQNERERIAHLLHDHVQQLLVGAKRALEMSRGSNSDEQREPLQTQAAELIGDAVTALRHLSMELHPPLLDEEGLAPALYWLGAHFQQVHGLRTAIHAEADAQPVQAGVRAFVFQSAREFLMNVVKHAGTEENAALHLHRDGESLHLEVRDKGPGCDTEKVFDHLNGGKSFGLAQIRRRARMLGGEAHMRQDDGCHITLTVPIGASLAAPAARRYAMANGDSPKEESPQMNEQRRRPGAAEQADGDGESHIRVLVADGHPAVRDGLAFILDRTEGIELVAEATSGAEALELARQVRPAIVIMDMPRPLHRAVELTQQFIEARVAHGVIVLAVEWDQTSSRRMLEAGASAYLEKSGAIGELVEVIRNAA